MKAICHSTYNFNLLHDFKESVEIWIDKKMEEESFLRKKIFVAVEPNVISRINDYIKQNYNVFDYVFCYDEELLEKIPNSQLFEYGTTWIYDDYSFSEKQNNISFVCNNKFHSKGHQLRQKVWQNQDKIKIDKKFFVSSRNIVPHTSVLTNEICGDLILGNSKYPLFNSMFHLTIENVSTNYYFSEKLIDCFKTKTIPVYWGCKKIENYFNTKGIIIVHDYKDIIEKCNSLTEKDYFNRIDAIEENYKLCDNWINFDERLTKKIIDNIK